MVRTIAWAGFLIVPVALAQNSTGPTTPAASPATAAKPAVQGPGSAAPPAGSPFNPQDYIQKKELDSASAAAAAEVKEGRVVVDGVRYRVFKTSSGRILVPHVDSFSASDLDKATCAQGTDPVREATFVKAERPLTTKATAYAEVIQKTIVARCYGDASPGPKEAWAPKGEIGVRIKDSDKPGSPSVKIFNEGAKPNVGVGAEF